MINMGSYLSALSPLWLVLWQEEWAAALFVLTLSLGEAVWSPRWYDYSMAVAPTGREGVFTALASAPLFVAMLPTGMLSGYLLDRYCPDNGACGDVSKGKPAVQPETGEQTCHGSAMWGLVTLLTLTSPLLILLTQARFLKGGAVGVSTLKEYCPSSRHAYHFLFLPQKWVRPAPETDEARDASSHPGECMDFNEADPLLLVENVSQTVVAPRRRGVE